MSKYPDDANGDVFRSLENQNFDFAQEVDVEFFAVFATEDEANKIALQYVEDRKAGARLKNIETRPHEIGGMELELVVEMKVTYDDVVAFENKLNERVSKVDGYLDGWGFLHD
ncbi:MAG: ribonuclease E inhibitor RraB [Proteobacteria bacterium]|nr:MAG: ribonuclease E inhibitor RraB [Pseudomonadota bacterium]